MDTLVAAYREATDGDGRLLLNGEWEFAEGPDGDPPTDGWERMRVPHRSREFEDEPPESGWYRTELRLPDGWDADGRIVLDLGRVRHFGARLSRR